MSEVREGEHDVVLRLERQGRGALLVSVWRVFERKVFPWDVFKQEA
jgi:hypothetical protein